MPDEEPLWLGVDLAGATGGRLVGRLPQAISGISIDSRTIAPGEAFFAIKGENFDGHDFAAKTLDAGAALAVVSEEKAPSIAKEPLIVVPDVLKALERLGRAARARSNAMVIGITGSVGKTGSKEALRAALSPSGETFASSASFNNHWGVPLSLSRFPQSSRFGVFEMGMNHPGEITPLAGMVRPHIAIITTIAPVHLGFFSSVDEIAAAKAEIFDGLEQGGTAVLNRDNSYFDYLAGRARDRGAGRVIGFGRNEHTDARLLKLSLKADVSLVEADICGQMVTYKIGAPGEHLAINSLGVLAAVSAAGADLAKAALALADWQAPKGRGKRIQINTPKGAITIVDESYNANPASMRAAIATLGAAEPQAGGRRIAVLGDMLELGEAGPSLHASLAEPLAQARVDLVYTAGPLMESLKGALPDIMIGGHVASSQGLPDLIDQVLRPGDVIMVKGSLGSRMGPVVEAIRGLAVLRFEGQEAQE